MPPPPFGTASAYADAFPTIPPSQLTISAETCFHLSVFKDTVKRYRRLDDQIITRLNRAQAQLRDITRTASAQAAAGQDGVEGMCTRLWTEMMTGWAHRQTMLGFCLQTVNTSLQVKRPIAQAGGDERLASAPEADAPKSGMGLREEQAVADSLANEQVVEAILRKRTIEAFKSRCPYFAPPPGSSARAWWDLADSGRVGKGPELS